MSMVIGTNVASLSAQRQIGMAVRDQGEAMERLSSGKRINSAKDDDLTDSGFRPGSEKCQ